MGVTKEEALSNELVNDELSDYDPEQDVGRPEIIRSCSAPPIHCIPKNINDNVMDDICFDGNSENPYASFEYFHYYYSQNPLNTRIPAPMCNFWGNKDTLDLIKDCRSPMGSTNSPPLQRINSNDIEDHIPSFPSALKCKVISSPKAKRSLSLSSSLSLTTPKKKKYHQKIVYRKVYRQSFPSQIMQ